MYQFEVKLTEPVDLPASLEWFGRWGEDLMERWDGRRLLRTIRIQGRSIPFAGHISGTVKRPAFRVIVRNERHAEATCDAVSRKVVTAAGTLNLLAETDPIIARLNQVFPGTRPVLQLDPFTSLIRSISAQQVNLKWALTTRNRLAQAFGIKHRLGDSFVYSLDPHRVAAADSRDIRALQFTTNKAKSICAVARAIVTNSVNLQHLDTLGDEDVMAHLTSIPGIGPWTADWFLVRTLGRARVVAGDLGVRKAVGLAYLSGRLPSGEEVRAATAHWGPASGAAQHLLLHALSHNAL